MGLCSSSFDGSSSAAASKSKYASAATSPSMVDESWILGGRRDMCEGTVSVRYMGKSMRFWA